jgi:DNA-binding response OmpR family regulator
MNENSNSRENLSSKLEPGDIFTMSETELKFKSILLVDDEQLIISMLSDILSDTADKIITAENGKEGLEKIQSEKPDIIISDIMMPEMNGFEFLKAVRENKEYDDIPFIFLTVKDTTRSIINGYDLGADYYLPKPFETKTLLHALEKAVYVRNKINQPTDDDI